MILTGVKQLLQKSSNEINSKISQVMSTVKEHEQNMSQAFDDMKKEISELKAAMH